MSTKIYRKGICLWIELIIVAVICAATQTASFAQCPVGTLQKETGAAQRSKFGWGCMDNSANCPPQYYLHRKVDRHWHHLYPDGCCDGSTTELTYDYSETDDDAQPSSDPANDGCPTTPIQTVSLSGTYSDVFSAACSDDTSYSSTITIDTNLNSWVDSNDNPVIDPWISWDGDEYVGIATLDGWGVTSLSCTFKETDMTNANNGTGYEKITLSNLYGTGTLETTVAGLAAGRVPTTFSDGNPSVVNTLDANEFCASAVRTPNWRIKITGAAPNKSYDISWLMVTKHANGTSQQTTITITRKAPNQDPWYVTSDPLPIPVWPQGCPLAGGTESVAYTGLDGLPNGVSIVLSPNQ